MYLSSALVNKRVTRHLNNHCGNTKWTRIDQVVSLSSQNLGMISGFIDFFFTVEQSDMDALCGMRAFFINLAVDDDNPSTSTGSQCSFLFKQTKVNWLHFENKLIVDWN